jgi:hypothetical protein
VPRRYHSFLPARIWIFWALFLVRGTFYSAMLPMWEGWDEYAHFAWIQHWSDQGTLPRATDSVSREIDESMRLAPLPWELNWIGPPYLTHADWWALLASERDERVRQLAALSPALAHQPAIPINGRPFVFYEAQQPPLFYWLASPVMRPASNSPIHDRVLLVRLFSVLLASMAIPFTFLAARRVLGSGAIYVAALLAVAPGFVIDAAHVANDGLAIGVTAIFLWLLTREKTSWIAAGTVLGAAILAKASLLVLAPVLMVLWFRRPKQMGLALALGFAIGGWWYWRNVLTGMPLTGWQESVPLSQVAVSAVALFHHGGWVNEAYTIAKSFTWFGAWSFITLRTWMYLALEGVAFSGMLASLRRQGLRAPLTFTIAFAIAIIGGAAAYYAVHNVAGIPGWYLWPAGGAMAMLIVAGLRPYSILFAALLALTDLYGAAARMMPYYAGLAARDHGSITQFSLAAARLHLPLWLAVLWIGATIAIPLLMFQRRAKTRM